MEERLRRLGERWPWVGRALDVQERVGEISGSSVASAITVTVFVSIFPLLLVTIAVVGFLARGNHHLAQDLTQTTYAKVFASWRRVCKAGNPVGYARTILLNTFLSHRRLRRSSELPGRVDLTETLAGLPAEARDAADSDTRLDLLAALQRHLIGVASIAAGLVPSGFSLADSLISSRPSSPLLRPGT